MLGITTFHQRQPSLAITALVAWIAVATGALVQERARASLHADMEDMEDMEERLG